VNLVTRRGGVPATRELEASGGSWGRYELKGHTGARHGLWDYYLGARYEHEQGWRQHTESRVATLFAKVGHLGTTWDATLSYSGADNRIFQAGSLPDRLAAARPDSNFTSGDYFAPQAHLVILNAQRLVGRTQLAVNGFGRAFESEQFNVNFVGRDSRQRNATGAGGGAVQLSGTLGLGARELSWLAGVDADYQHVAVRIFAVPRTGAPDSLTAWVQTQQVSAGAFAGASVEVVPRLTATVAGRYDWIRVPFEDRLTPSQNGVNVFRRLSPRIGVTWRTQAHEAFVSVSRGFRAPAVVEIGCADPVATCPLPFALGADPVLNPVVATTYELGWHYRAPPGGLDASANVYRTDVRDEIFFIASSVTGGYFQNISATRRAGVELALQWLGPRGQRAYVNYGYTHATFATTARLATARDTTGETVQPGDVLPMVPDHRLNAGVALSVLNRRGSESGLAAVVGLDARYVGRQWLRGDEANVTARLPDYGVADLSLTLAWRDWALRWAVGNVLDARYASFGTYAPNPTVPGRPVERWLAPGLPRHLQVSLSSDF
jgi:outer membrane receptor protein involved in Fe transport